MGIYGNLTCFWWCFYELMGFKTDFRRIYWRSRTKEDLWWFMGRSWKYQRCLFGVAMCSRTAEVSTPENMSQFTNVGEGSYRSQMTNGLQRTENWWVTFRNRRKVAHGHMSLWNSKFRREKGKNFQNQYSWTHSQGEQLSTSTLRRRIFAVLAGGNSTNFNQQKL